MSISGRLTETNLPTLLQVLAQGKRSGRLSVARGSARAVVLLRGGRLIYAVSSSLHETLGNILVCEKAITEDTLRSALEQQHTRSPAPRLGTVLIEMGALTHDRLERVLEEQTIRVLREIMGWEDGFFRFDKVEMSEEDLLDFDLSGFLADEGLRVDRLLIGLAEAEAAVAGDSAIVAGDSAIVAGDSAIVATDGAAVAETGARVSAEAGARVGADTAPFAVPEAPADPPQRIARPAHDSVSLREIARYLHQPVLNAEMTAALLRYAGSRADRTLLLARDEDALRGIAQAGPQIAQTGGSSIRDLRIAIAEPSIFADVIHGGEPISGPLDGRAAHRAVIDALGGSEPADVLVLPLVVHRSVAFVLYCDVLENRIRAREELEVLILQAGLAMEKALLEQRLQSLEDRLAAMPPARPSARDELPASSSLIAQLLAGKPG